MLLRSFSDKWWIVFSKYLDRKAPLGELILLDDAPEEAKQAFKEYLEWLANRPKKEPQLDENGIPMETYWV